MTPARHSPTWVTHQSLARAGVALELLVVLTQALVAAWFYRLFRTVHRPGASGIAAFGLVNAAAVLISAAFLATAVELAADPAAATADSAATAATVQLLYLISGNLWSVGGLFFGLWLIPMGWCVLRSGWMPRALGWILVAGGIGYILNALVAALAPELPVLADALVLPSTVGEFWMVGYLLVHGVRRRALAEEPAGPQVPTSEAGPSRASTAESSPDRECQRPRAAVRPP